MGVEDNGTSTRSSSEEALVRGTEKLLSQCRGRGFESHHLHQRSCFSGAQSGTPRISFWSGATLRDLIGEGADECYMRRCRGRRCESAAGTKETGHGADSRISGTVRGATARREFAFLYRQSLLLLVGRIESSLLRRCAQSLSRAPVSFEDLVDRLAGILHRVVCSRYHGVHAAHLRGNGVRDVLEAGNPSRCQHQDWKIR